MKLCYGCIHIVGPIVVYSTDHFHISEMIAKKNPEESTYISKKTRSKLSFEFSLDSEWIKSTELKTKPGQFRSCLFSKYTF